MTAAMDRVLARTMVTDQCWLWLGSRCTKGYGELSVDNRNTRVHRVAYESFHGSIPAGLVIDHTCHDPAVCVGGNCIHRLCVNPAHLEAVTNEVNLARQSPAHKTHCVHGHPRTPENLFFAGGSHSCRVCRSERQANYVPNPESAAARAWAQEQGMKVGVRGRLSRAILDAYRAAMASDGLGVAS